MFPEQNNYRRTVNSLHLWVLEAKGVQAKRRYFCELCCDKTLYGRTSSKLKSADMCFWGESFVFNHLPKLEVFCVNLYREADKKKRRDRNTLIGYVSIPVSVLVGKQPVERWYTVTSADQQSNKGDLPSLRIKAKYQTVHILPIRCYNRFLQYLKQNYLTICNSLEASLSAKCKEDLATSLVRVLHHQKVAKEFITDLIMQEVKRLDNDHLMFRGNSLATKAMESYMKLIGEQYLRETLGDFVRNVTQSVEFEVDPVKVQNAAQLDRNQNALHCSVKGAWEKIMASVSYFPAELRELFATVKSRLSASKREDLADKIISSSIFLRFLCPAVLSPSLFGLMNEFPCEKSNRSLTLVAKVLQTLANFTQFGGKEQYMEFMNVFVNSEWSNMKDFLVKISKPLAKDEHAFEYRSLVDLGKELSLLHFYLTDTYASLSEHSQNNLKDLKLITDSLNDELQSPNYLSDSFNQRGRNGLRCDLGSPLSDYENASSGSASPTSHNLLSASISHQAPGIQNNKPDLKEGSVSYVSFGGAGDGVRYSSRQPAPHLGTADDYVVCTAFSSDSAASAPGPQPRSNLRMDTLSPHVRLCRTQNDIVPEENNYDEPSTAVIYHDPSNQHIGDVSHDSGGPDEHAESMSGGEFAPSPMIIRKCHKGSHGSIASSSGYHSLPNSTASSSNSPVETPGNAGTAADFLKSNAANPSQSHLRDATDESSYGQQHQPPLAFANPLYSLQTMPLLKSTSGTSGPTGQNIPTYSPSEHTMVDCNNMSPVTSISNNSTISNPDIYPSGSSTIPSRYQRHPVPNSDIISHHSRVFSEPANSGNKVEPTVSGDSATASGRYVATVAAIDPNAPLSTIASVISKSLNTPRPSTPPSYSAVTVQKSASGDLAADLTTTGYYVKTYGNGQADQHTGGAIVTNPYSRVNGVDPSGTSSVQGTPNRYLIKQHSFIEDGTFPNGTPNHAATRRTSLGYARHPAPRTNPRFCPSASASVSSSMARSPQMSFNAARTGLRRTATDSAICLHQHPLSYSTSGASSMSPNPSSDHVTAATPVPNGTVEPAIMADITEERLNQKYSTELETVKKQLRETEERLREAQAGEWKWKQRYHLQQKHSGNRSKTLPLDNLTSFQKARSDSGSQQPQQQRRMLPVIHSGSALLNLVESEQSVIVNGNGAAGDRGWNGKLPNHRSPLMESQSSSGIAATVAGALNDPRSHFSRLKSTDI